MPASRRARVPDRVRSWTRPSASSSSTVPADAGRIPMTVSTSSVCPLPSTPAMPSTSPACTVRDTSSSAARPESSPVRRSPVTRSTGRSVTVDAPVVGLGSSEPTIISASSVVPTVAASTVPTVVPRRSTVTRSAIRRTSSSLCEMNRKV